MSSPWAFGWTQLLTIAGFVITISIALGGFQSFARWQRQKFEEKRIDTAVDALVLIREMKWVFENIRSPMSFEYEWKDMPETLGDSEDLRRQRGSFYAVLKRIGNNKEFFERAWKVQIKCGALFGEKAEDALLLIQKARRQVEVSAEMLARNPFPQVETKDNKRTWERFRVDVWAGYGGSMGLKDTISEKLEECGRSIEAICRPSLDRQYATDKRFDIDKFLKKLGL